MTNLLLRLFFGDVREPENSRFRHRCGRFAGIVGIVCNGLLCIAKLLVGILTGAVAVTADGINNLSDAASSVVTLVSFRLAEKPADEDHPFGHARIEYVSGMIVSILILFIGYEIAKTSLGKILHPEPAGFSLMTVAILAGSILLKLWLCLFDRKVGALIHSPVLTAAAADSRNDVLATAAVLAGCLVERFFGLRLDGYIGLAIAVFILYSGVELLRDTADPLLGKAPDKAELHLIRERLLAHDAVLGIHDLIVHDYGPGQRFASVHVELDRNLDVMVGHELIDDIEREFAETSGLQMVIHYDPIVTDDEAVEKTKAWVADIIRSVEPQLTFHDFRMVAGHGHTNLIFDLVVPFSLAEKKDALKTQIVTELCREHPEYYTVITVDCGAFNEP